MGFIFFRGNSSHLLNRIGIRVKKLKRGEPSRLTHQKRLAQVHHVGGGKSQGRIQASQALTHVLMTVGWSLKAMIWFCFIFTYGSSKAEHKVTRGFKFVGSS